MTPALQARLNALSALPPPRTGWVVSSSGAFTLPRMPQVEAEDEAEEQARITEPRAAGAVFSAAGTSGRSYAAAVGPAAARPVSVASTVAAAKPVEKPVEKQVETPAPAAARPPRRLLALEDDKPSFSFSPAKSAEEAVIPSEEDKGDGIRDGGSEEKIATQLRPPEQNHEAAVRAQPTRKVHEGAAARAVVVATRPGESSPLVIDGESSPLVIEPLSGEDAEETLLREAFDGDLRSVNSADGVDEEEDLLALLGGDSDDEATATLSQWMFSLKPANNR